MNDDNMVSENDYYFEDDDGNLRHTTITDHVARGKCSGIPQCCIDHYMSNILDNDYIDNTPDNWFYMPCLDCIRLNNRVEVKDCSDDNGKNCTCGAWANSIVVEP